MKINHKIQQWIMKEFPHHSANAIIDDGQGAIMAFGKYVIRPCSQGGYSVATLGDKFMLFGSGRSAMAYCVADKYQNFNLARRILQLDQQKTLMRHDLDVRRHMAERSRNAAFTETVLTKIQHKSSVCRDISSELDKCVDLAKYMQLRGFTNETARTRRSKSHP